MVTMATSVADVAGLRAFNRLYTQRLGFLNERLDNSPFSLTEARVMYELAHRARPTAAEIGRALDLDRGQLSRVLKRLEQSGLVEWEVSEAHAKHRLLILTIAGRGAFADLDRATQAAVVAFLGTISPGARRRLFGATAEIAKVLEEHRQPQPSVVLRAPRLGDVGWVVHRQALLYVEEYGWDWLYEALVAEILAGFVQTLDPGREQGWIADLDGAIVGSVFLMRSSNPSVAKLRLLYVEPAARGLGLGRDLVDACISRARQIGYDKLELWTNSVLVSARRIYETAGFQLQEEAAHRSFGQDLIGQVWRLDLGQSGEKLPSRSGDCSCP